MDFIADYVCYHSAYEIPRNYVYWSAFGLIGAIVNRKVYFAHGDIEIPCQVYILLVGPQGNKKSTPCVFAKRMFQLVCPDLEIGASTQSAEDIVVQMSKDGFARCFTNEKGEQIEVRPYAFFINEFKDFIAYSSTRMLNFLGNIYDENPFRANTIKRGSENIINPSVNILGCENPDQLSKFMKNDIFTGGLSRRFILVNEPDYAEPKPFIEISPDGPERQAWKRVHQRLIDVRKVVGRFQWTESGRKFYAPWYTKTQRSLREISNPLVKGFVSTLHIQLFKICMHLDVVSDKPMFQFTGDLLEHGLSFFEVIRPNMEKLSSSSGRNEMAQSYQKALDIIKQAGGMFAEKKLRQLLEIDLSPMEIYSALRHLEETDQVVKKLMAIPNGEGVKVERWMFILPEFYRRGIKEGRFKES